MCEPRTPTLPAACCGRRGGGPDHRGADDTDAGRQRGDRVRIRGVQRGRDPDTSRLNRWRERASAAENVSGGGLGPDGHPAVSQDTVGHYLFSSTRPVIIGSATGPAGGVEADHGLAVLPDDFHRVVVMT